MMQKRIAFLLSVLIFTAMLTITPGASAQIVNSVPTSQHDLMNKSFEEQGTILAEIVRNSNGVGSKPCDSAKAFFKKLYNEGSGGWLVQCTGGMDQWVMVPAIEGKGAVVLNCPLMKATNGQDCYKPN